jgi:hypothetical protein
MTKIVREELAVGSAPAHLFLGVSQDGTAQIPTLSYAF